MTPKAKKTKEKVIKNFCTKGYHQESKKTGREKISTNYRSDKNPLSRIHKELLQLNNKK